MDIQVPLENDFETHPENRFVMLPVNASWVAPLLKNASRLMRQ